MEAIARTSTIFPTNFLPNFPSKSYSKTTLYFPLKFPKTPLIIKPKFEVKSSVEGVVALEENPNETKDKIVKRKLYVVNLPWTLSSDELKSLFSQCGTVKDVELIRDKDGRNRGYGFVTMASGDEAQAVIDKFHSKELSGRTIRVEFAKRLQKPRPQPQPPTVAVKETHHKIYVSNLQWKVRSTHLKEFFSANFTPVSARVVFENSPAGRSAGYGFVSFSTKEEAKAAISSLDGQELLGRPVRLKFSEQNNEGEVSNVGEEKDSLQENTAVVDENGISEDQPGRS